jgi:hypothetical protein
MITPDTRTPGQVMWDAVHFWPDAEPWGYRSERNTEYERYAAAVLAHDAAQRAARGEVMVDARDLLRIMRYVEAEAARTGPAVAAMARLRAAIAVWTHTPGDRPMSDAAKVIDVITGGPAHRMAPGSHERPSGAECICGGQWDTWNEGCCRHAQTIFAKAKETDR